MISEPSNLTDDQKKRIIKAELYKRGGGKISCGHDFHAKMKEVDFGDTVFRQTMLATMKRKREQNEQQD